VGELPLGDTAKSKSDVCFNGELAKGENQRKKAVARGEFQRTQPFFLAKGGPCCGKLRFGPFVGGFFMGGVG